MKTIGMREQKPICGISVCNPFDIEESYVNQTVDYAIQKGYNHIQFIGPIHHPVKGNIDGMVFYRKYAQFNNEKDETYVNLATRVLNAACEKASAAGIKTYVWHHELELPSGFKEAFPNILNKYQDIEVSGPEVKDFLEHKIIDFFEQYPKMDGIILTLHETKVPLLKLKDQKLDKVERVKYVTKILYDTCNRLGKELIVRPFASVEEDYALMTQAYEEISKDMLVMDKWTQFDWSLCLPHNAFYKKIKKNPLFVEADIFGEYFGKGRLPLMLKSHIMEKHAYCEQFAPAGYCARIDRSREKPFGDVNAVNMDIMHACLTGKDVDEAIDEFFFEKYSESGSKVRKLMEPTEEILRKIIYLNGYYFSELSIFPSLNHSKNHFYFEIMKDAYTLVSDEWFIPRDWQRGTIDELIVEKQEAKLLAEKLYEEVLLLKSELAKEDYETLRVKFYNLAIVASVWHVLTTVFLYYTKYFEFQNESYKTKLYEALVELELLDQNGKREVGEQFYCVKGNRCTDNAYFDFIPNFINEVKQSFEYEKSVVLEMRQKEDLIDYVVCGGGFEGHELKKEVNFSDTMMINNKLCRIPDTLRGLTWCTVNGHGWFSYLLQVKPGVENKIRIYCGSNTSDLDVQVTIGNEIKEIHESCEEDKVIEIVYTPLLNEEKVRIRFDKIAGNTPYIYLLEVNA